jgi:antitoxin component YwqK of YwqJK toxin-antitoxin module
MKLVALLFILTTFFCSSQKIMKTYYDYQKTQLDEVYLINARGQKNGLYTKYDEEGAKAVEANYVNGILNGPSKEYYRNKGAEKIKKSGNFLNDKKQGLFTTYTYVKYDQSYYEIMNNLMFNEKSDDIFNTGLKVKVRDEYYENDEMTKEIQYHKTGKMYFSTSMEKTETQFTCYNEKNVLLAKGSFSNLDGKMIGTWVIPREENGETPSDKNLLYGEPKSSIRKYNNVAYVQHIHFKSNGIIDTNYMSKSYYLSGILKDSVKLKSIDYSGGLSYNGINYGGSKLDMYGPYRSYHENGKLSMEGEYALRKEVYEKVGIWKTYDLAGNLTVIDYDSLFLAKEKVLNLREKLGILYDSVLLGDQSLYDRRLGVGLYQGSKTNSMNGQYGSDHTVSVKENGSYVTYYIKYKKPTLYKSFVEIKNFLMEMTDYSASKILKITSLNDERFVEFYTKENERYTSIITNLEKCITLIQKMKEIHNSNTKDLENALQASKTIEEKIILLNNFQIK